MPKLELNREVKVSADRALSVLGHIDQYQNFIPGCKESTIESCDSPRNNVWQGKANCAFEFKKYAIHEKALVLFHVDGDERTVRFGISQDEGNAHNAEAHYTVTGQGCDRSVVTLNLEYPKPEKKYFWIIAKPLIRRFFYKFVDLIEARAQRADQPARLSFNSAQAVTEVETGVRGFRQLDQRSQEARMKLLTQFPRGSSGAEIGTYMGGFAQLILDTVKPRKLYLIDPWIASKTQSQTGSWYDTVDQGYMDDIFDMVSQRFSERAGITNVEIIRDYSSNALRTLRDGELDWVYIDGDHSYETVLGDLKLSFEKVRIGGFISGDDYVVVDNWWKDNVVRAVTEFSDAYPVDLMLGEGSQFLLRKR